MGKDDYDYLLWEMGGRPPRKPVDYRIGIWVTWVLVVTGAILGIILGLMSISNTIFLWIVGGLALVFFGIGYVIFQSVPIIEEDRLQVGKHGFFVVTDYKEDDSSWQSVLGFALICNSILFASLFSIFGVIKMVLSAIRMILS